MQEIEYYDCKNNCTIDVENDGCTLEKWREGYEKAPFAKHPNGFPIFLSVDEMKASDEYKEGDPYAVEQGIETGADFQERRIELTVPLFQLAIKRIHGNPKVLDIGCGKGFLTNELLKSSPICNIAGLDYSLSAIEYAQKNFPAINFAVANAYKPPYPKEYFDIIICNNIWEHVPDPLYLLKMISYVLKPKGFLIISTPNRYRRRNLLKVILGKPISLISPHHVTEYSIGQVTEQLEYGGFIVDKVLSRPLKTRNIKARITGVLFSLFRLITGSHHRLESTIFYLAQK